MEGRRERKREKGRDIDERDTSMCCLHHAPPPLIGVGIKPATQVLALDRESNQQPLGLQADAPTTKPNHPGLSSLYFNKEDNLIKLGKLAI